MHVENLSTMLMQAMYLVLWLSMPSIAVASIVGVLVSIFQALTQIQEQTLSFAIKLVAIGFTIFYTAGFTGAAMYSFTLRVFALFPVVMR